MLCHEAFCLDQYQPLTPSKLSVAQKSLAPKPAFTIVSHQTQIYSSIVFQLAQALGIVFSVVDVLVHAIVRYNFLHRVIVVIYHVLIIQV